MKYKIKEIVGNIGVVLMLLGVFGVIATAIWGLIASILSGHVILGCLGLAFVVAITGAVIVGISG